MGGWLEKMGIKLSQPQLELKLSWVELRLSLAITLNRLQELNKLNEF